MYICVNVYVCMYIAWYIRRPAYYNVPIIGISTYVRAMCVNGIETRSETDIILYLHGEHRVFYVARDAILQNHKTTKFHTSLTFCTFTKM